MNRRARIAVLSLAGFLGWPLSSAMSQSDRYVRNWQPAAAAMQCVAQPHVNGIPAVSPLDGSCMDSGLRSRFENEYSRIAAWMSRGRLHSPDYLRPVVPSPGSDALLLYVNPSRDDYAAYASPCSNDVRTRGVGGIIEFNNDPARLNQPGVPSAVLVHEIAHAVQFASAFALTDVRFCKGTRLTPVLNWVREGTADALAWEYVRTYLPNEWKVLINRGSKLWKRAAGLRPYDHPLQFREATAGGENDYLYSKQQNYASSFWRHLAWRYHGGDVRFVRSLFDTRIDAPNDWTRWANDVLKRDRTTRDGFYTTYPTFIADWASMNTTDKFKSAGIPDAVWRKALFAGCPTIDVRKGLSKYVDFTLKQLSAKCIKLKVDGLNEDEIGTIRIFGSATGGAPIEELHLSEIERISADKRRCSEILDSIVGLGQKPIPGVDCVVHRTIPTGTPGTATFEPSPLYGSAGDDLIVMAMARVGTNPGDDDSLAGVQAEGFRLHVSVDTSVVTLGAGGPRPAQPSFIDSRVWTNAHLPIDITHQMLAAQQGLMRGPASGLGMAGAPVVTTEMFTGFNPVGAGAWSISFDTYDVQVDRSPYGSTHGYEPTGAFALHLKEPQALVAGQTYEAYATYSDKRPGSFMKALTGSGASPPRGRSDFDPTLITVIENSEQRLAFSFAGRICMGANLMAMSRNRSEADCMSIEPLSGTISVSHPKLYSMDGLLKYDQQSEGNRIYREQIAAQYNRTMAMAFGGAASRGAATAGGSARGGPGSRSAAPGAPAEGSGQGSRVATAEPCDCSCEAYDTLRNAGKSDKPVNLGNLMRCAIKCARAYSECGR